MRVARQFYIAPLVESQFLLIIALPLTNTDLGTSATAEIFEGRHALRHEVTRAGAGCIAPRSRSRYGAVWSGRGGRRS